MAGSISKGCFVHKPKGKNAKSDLFFENDQTFMYEKITNTIEKSLVKIYKDIQINLFNDLLNFVETPQPDRILTALLMLGVNVSDHSVFFKQLSNHLRSTASMIALVSSKNCAAIKNFIQCIVTQLITNSVTDTSPNNMETESDIDSEEEEVHLKRNQYDLLNFQDFYTESKSKDKIVIILQDYESCSTLILNEFLLILNEYQQTLPFVLIFGISTAPSIVHSTLNHDVISTLKIHTFLNQPSVECLNLITEKIIFNSKFPILLHHSIIEFLIDNFLFYDFSLNTFMKGVKICILKHLSSNSINVLCLDIMMESLTKKSLNASVLNEISKLDSIAKLNIKKLDADIVINYANVLFVFISNMYTSLRCLYTLVYDLPNHPLGKHLRDVYCFAFRDNSFTENSKFKLCLQLLQFISKQELIRKVNTIADILMENEDLDIEYEKARQLQVEIENADTEVQIKKNSENKLNLTPKSRAQLKQSLLENIKNDKIQYEFDVKREKFVLFLINNLFNKYLIPVQGFPLHEIVLFKETSLLKKYLAGAPRAAIHTALNNPQYYLQCECCKINNSYEILSSMPDVCIVYKLHLENASLINMHDWLQSFSTIVNPEDNISEATIKARFTQAVSELQFLGFIKNCKQKIDHVKRLTWGDS